MADALTAPTPDGVARPQPLGAFPLPLGYLLVPGGADTDAVRRELVAGRVPDRWPAALRAHERSLAGDRHGALAALDDLPDAVARYNRFVLDPDAGDPDALRGELGELAALVDLVLFVLGRSDVAPQVGALDGELAALVLAAQATAALGAGDGTGAVELLDRAVERAAPSSPPLAGLLLGAAGSILRDRDDPACVERFERALTLLAGASALHVGRAEIHLGLAHALHEQARDRPELLPAAVPHYHSVLQLVGMREAPLTWAAAHAGLATAYLTMPMVEASSRLRLGIAAQSLRSALTVYTREDHPAEWASVALNLANSLVYAPSRHQADNLIEAVGRYEEVLAIRDRATDPLGRARVLANLGTVLAHLGRFDDATARLREARSLFEEHADDESVHAVRGVLDEITRQAAPAAASTGVGT
ncbi:MAG: tetratricopeptide repeat protein [Pseudonocardia sp.]|nr:tetratricopeptide repeat protein [Pseudonocardia sp.]